MWRDAGMVEWNSSFKFRRQSFTFWNSRQKLQMPVAAFQIAGKKFQKGKTGLMLPFTASSMYGLPFILYVPSCTNGAYLRLFPTRISIDKLQETTVYFVTPSFFAKFFCPKNQQVGLVFRIREAKQLYYANTQIKRRRTPLTMTGHAKTKGPWRLHFSVLCAFAATGSENMQK